MFCRNCGNKLSEGDRFCPACGKPIDVRKVVTKPQTIEESASDNSNNDVNPAGRSESAGKFDFVTDWREEEAPRHTNIKPMAFDWSSVTEESHKKDVSDIKSPWDGGDDTDGGEDGMKPELDLESDMSTYSDNRNRTMTFIDIIKQERAEKEAREAKVLGDDAYKPAAADRGENGESGDVTGYTETILPDNEREKTQGYTDLRHDIIAELEKKESEKFAAKNDYKSDFEEQLDYIRSKSQEPEREEVDLFADEPVDVKRGGGDAAKDYEPETRIESTPSSGIGKSVEDLYVSDEGEEVEDVDEEIADLQRRLDALLKEKEEADKEEREEYGIDDENGAGEDFSEEPSYEPENSYEDYDFEDEDLSDLDNFDDEDEKDLDAFDKYESEFDIDSSNFGDDEDAEDDEDYEDEDEVFGDEEFEEFEKSEEGDEAVYPREEYGIVWDKPEEPSVKVNRDALREEEEPVDEDVEEEISEAVVDDTTDEEAWDLSEYIADEGQEAEKTDAEPLDQIDRDLAELGIGDDFTKPAEDSEFLSESEFDIEPDLQDALDDIKKAEPEKASGDYVFDESDYNDQEDLSEEDDLFAGDFVGDDEEATKKIEKFYTLYRKNEEFQKLLDEEYRKLRGEDAGEVLGDLSAGDENFDIYADPSEASSAQAEAHTARAGGAIDDDIDTVEKVLGQGAAGSAPLKGASDTAAHAPEPGITGGAFDDNEKKAPVMEEPSEEKEKSGKASSILTVIAIIVAVILVVLLVIILIMNFAPNSGIAQSLNRTLGNFSNLFGSAGGVGTLS